jgi:hypothetical protein
MEAIMTIPEVARYLKISKSKIYYLVQLGGNPPFQNRAERSDQGKRADEVAGQAPRIDHAVAGLHHMGSCFGPG